MVINTQQILIYGTHKYLLQGGTRGILSLNRASNWNLRWDVTKSVTINNENREIELLSLSDQPINTRARTVEKKIAPTVIFQRDSACQSITTAAVELGSIQQVLFNNLHSASRNIAPANCFALRTYYSGKQAKNQNSWAKKNISYLLTTCKMC